MKKIVDFDKESFKKQVISNVKMLFRKDMDEATPQMIYQAVAYAVAVRYGIKAPTLENVQTDPKMQPQDVTRVFDRIDFAIGRITRQLEEGPELKKQAKLEAEKQAAEAKQKEREKKEEKPKLREIPHPPNLEGRR